MSHAAALPMPGAESGLASYLRKIQRFPIPEPQEGYMPAKRWREHRDRDAAHRLVTSHLRLLAKIREKGASGEWQDWPADRSASQQRLLVGSAELVT